MSDFDWPDVSYFQAKFGWERVKASKVILNYSKLSFGVWRWFGPTVHFGLESGMVFEGTTGVYDRIYCFSPK